jgi:hypothetical protein
MAFEVRKGTLVAPSTGAMPVRQNITGLPFQPKAVIFFDATSASLNTTQNSILHSFGAAVSSTSQFAIAAASDGAGATTANTGRISRINTECIVLPLNGNPAINGLARFVSFNADGFSLDWTDTMASSGVLVHYMAFGGADLTNVAIAEVTPSSTTNGTTQAVNFGFAPDAIITTTPGVPSTTGIADANICIGAAVRQPSTSQYAAFWFENDGAAPMDLAVYAARNRAGAAPGSTATKDADYSISAWTGTGVTITWDDAPAQLTQRHYMLAFKGGRYEIDFIGSPAATGNQTITTDFEPRGVFFFGSGDITDTDNTASSSTAASNFMIGGVDASLNQGTVAFVQTDANSTAVSRRRQSTTQAVTWISGTTGTVAATASVQSGGITPTGYTLNWGTANATSWKFAGLAFFDTFIPPPGTTVVVPKGMFDPVLIPEAWF